MTRFVSRQLSIWTLFAFICLCSVQQVTFAQTVAETIEKQNEDSSQQEHDESDTQGNSNNGGTSENPTSDSNQLDSNENELLPTSQADHPLVLLGKLIFYLVFVLVLIYALIRFLAARQRKVQNHSVFQNLGGLSLGTNKSLQLVKIGQSLYVIGVADQITLIKELHHPDEQKSVLVQLEEQGEFLTNRWFASWPWSKSKKEDQPSTFSFQDMFKQSIDHQRSKQHEIEKQLQKHNSEEKEGRF